MRAVSTESSYKSIEKLILSKGRNLYIISPYVSEYYLKMLQRLSSRKNIYLITGGEAYQKALGYSAASLSKPKPLHGFMIFSAIVVSAILSQYQLALIFMDVLSSWSAFFAFAVISSRKRKKGMKVKTVKGNFVHEKVYISDNYAITGSANLTYSGLHKNTERIALINDKKELKSLRQHFEELWKKAS